jgi:hypothetical protein
LKSTSRGWPRSRGPRRRVARADRVVVVGVLVVVRAVARAVEVVVLRVLRVLEAALLFLRGEALGLGGLLRGELGAWERRRN